MARINNEDLETTNETTPSLIHPAPSSLQNVLPSSVPDFGQSSSSQDAQMTSMLQAPDTSDNEDDSLDRILELHFERLDNTLFDAADGLVEDKDYEIQMKSAQIAELENELVHKTREIEALHNIVKTWERTTIRLHKIIKEITRDNYVVSDESLGEERMGMKHVRVECKVCVYQEATVIMWPCNHLAVCTRCDAVIKGCPVCNMQKITSIKICYPTDP